MVLYMPGGVEDYEAARAAIAARDLAHQEEMEKVKWGMREEMVLTSTSSSSNSSISSSSSTSLSLIHI